MTSHYLQELGLDYLLTGCWGSRIRRNDGSIASLPINNSKHISNSSGNWAGHQSSVPNHSKFICTLKRVALLCHCPWRRGKIRKGNRNEMRKDRKHRASQHNEIIGLGVKEATNENVFPSRWPFWPWAYFFLIFEPQFLPVRDINQNWRSKILDLQPNLGPSS